MKGRLNKKVAYLYSEAPATFKIGGQTFHAMRLSPYDKRHKRVRIRAQIDGFVYVFAFTLQIPHFNNITQRHNSQSTILRMKQDIWELLLHQCWYILTTYLQ